MKTETNPERIDILYCVEWGFLKAAAGLADAIKDTFGKTARLIEAHDGLFEIRLNDAVVYTNQSTCSRVPTLPEALETLACHIGPLPGKEQRAKNAFPLL